MTMLTRIVKEEILLQLNAKIWQQNSDWSALFFGFISHWGIHSGVVGQENSSDDPVLPRRQDEQPERKVAQQPMIVKSLCGLRWNHWVAQHEADLIEASNQPYPLERRNRDDRLSQGGGDWWRQPHSSMESKWKHIPLTSDYTEISVHTSYKHGI